MKKNLFVLLAGVLIGSTGTLMLGTNNNDALTRDSAELSVASIAEMPQDSPERIATGNTIVKESSHSPETSEGASSIAVRQVASITDSSGSTIGMPDFDLAEPYASMVRPPEQPKMLRTPELFERFLEDGRDNSWADSMEAGMKQLEAEIGAEYQTAFDSVECRSRYCVIAGVTYSQEPQPWNPVMSELSSSGWWQGAGGTSISATSNGSETHFLAIVSREPIDTFRDPGTQTDKTGESSVKVAQLDGATR